MTEIDYTECQFLNMSKECRAINNELCKNISDCHYKQLQQLKAENEGLKKENEEIYKIGCENFVVIDQAKRLYKFNKCLDEIEESFCKEYYDSTYIEEAHIAYWAKRILQPIEQAKEG